MRNFLLVVIFTTSALVMAQGGAANHIRAAIKINTTRAPLYAALSNDASLVISQTLIKAEKQQLIGATFLDVMALPYQKAGIPIGKIEFVSMGQTPKFASTYAFPLENLNVYQTPKIKSLKLKLRTALSKSFEEFSAVAAIELKNAEQHRNYHCMLRHFLESMIRGANVAPQHIKKAVGMHVPSPAWLSKLMIRAQINRLNVAIELDQLAAPVQAKNIPILCNDLPYIPSDVENFE